MKKITIILALAAVLMLTMVSVASAAVNGEEKTFSSNEEFYYEIESILQRLHGLLSAGKTKEAQNLVNELRSVIYQCARFLAGKGAYDVRIILVLNYAEKALVEKDADQVGLLLQQSRELAETVLLTKVPSPVEGGSKHS